MFIRDSNGSGKHNNWSVVTNTGVNLFNPGQNPSENLPFLAALACTIKAVDELSLIHIFCRDEAFHC